MTGAATRFLFDAEVRRRSQIGGLDSLDAGRITLAEYVAGSWAVAHGASLAPATRKRYGYLYDRHVLPELGPLELRQISPEVIARWQADRLACGSGPVAVHDALTLLGGILQRAVEGRHLVVNPARAVRRAPLPRRSEVPPLAPISIERMRACADAGTRR